MFYTTESWATELLTLTRRRTYCYRIDDSIGLKFSIHQKSLGTSLSAQHRAELRNHLPHYDIFIYQEDDIIFKFKHLVAFVEESHLLRTILPSSEWLGCGIGFLRYRRIMRKDAEIHSQAWGATDVIEQDMLEELPNLRPICLGSGSRSMQVPYLICEGNTHQAMWILTRDQVKGLSSRYLYIFREYCVLFLYKCVFVTIIQNEYYRRSQDLIQNVHFLIKRALLESTCRVCLFFEICLWATIAEWTNLYLLIELKHFLCAISTKVVIRNGMQFIYRTSDCVLERTTSPI